MLRRLLRPDSWAVAKQTNCDQREAERNARPDFSFNSVTCGNTILSNRLGNQAFAFSVNGTAVIFSGKFFQTYY